MSVAPRRPLDQVLHRTFIAMVRSDRRDLTARQLAAFLICYLTEEGQTVRGLAAELNISKPAVTRSLDRLETFSLVRRKPDPRDRRSVLIGRTPAGTAYIGQLRKMLTTASAK
jgi:DNA-binding MarR family transcriptional regulator